jgi:hypothetical protein
MWVQGCRGDERNEILHQLAKKVPELPFIGPDLACSIFERAAKQVIKNWMNRKHYKCRQSTQDKNTQRISFKKPLPKN